LIAAAGRENVPEVLFLLFGVLLVCGVDPSFPTFFYRFAA
jgi:hypothetical protein